MVLLNWMHSSNIGKAGITTFYIQYKYYISLTKAGVLVKLLNLEESKFHCILAKFLTQTASFLSAHSDIASRS